MYIRRKSFHLSTRISAAPRLVTWRGILVWQWIIRCGFHRNSQTEEICKLIKRNIFFNHCGASTAEPHAELLHVTTVWIGSCRFNLIKFVKLQYFPTPALDYQSRLSLSRLFTTFIYLMLRFCCCCCCCFLALLLLLWLKKKKKRRNTTYNQ